MSVLDKAEGNQLKFVFDAWKLFDALEAKGFFRIAIFGLKIVDFSDKIEDFMKDLIGPRLESYYESNQV